MSNTDNVSQYILLDNLFNIFLDMKYAPEDAEELFNESGLDIEQIVQKNMKLIRQFNTQAKAELNKVKHDRVLEFLNKIKAGLASGIQEYQNLADEIFSQPKFAEVHKMYRNLEEVTEQDKNAMLMDSKLLDVLSEIEEEYNKE